MNPKEPKTLTGTVAGALAGLGVLAYGTIAGTASKMNGGAFEDGFFDDSLIATAVDWGDDHHDFVREKLGEATIFNLVGIAMRKVLESK